MSWKQASYVLENQDSEQVLSLNLATPNQFSYYSADVAAYCKDSRLHRIITWVIK